MQIVKCNDTQKRTLHDYSCNPKEKNRFVLLYYVPLHYNKIKVHNSVLLSGSHR